MTEEAKACALCGTGLRRNNRTGYCGTTPECRAARKVEYRKMFPEDSERVNARQRAYYSEDVKERIARWNREHPEVKALTRARQRAKKKGVPFSLTKQDIPPIPEVCPVLGIPLRSTKTRGGDGNSPALDRIKPALGYVPGNIQWISAKANMIKSDATSDELFRVAEFVRRLEDG